MTSPKFLSSEYILKLHHQAVEAHGGMHGLRDGNGFLSAVNQPVNAHLYTSADHFEIAAASTFHWAESQCFIDGNKRVAILSALTYLAINHIHIMVDENILYDAMIALAEKRLDKPGLAVILRKSCPSS